jgi:hypothetical protein
MTAWTGAVDWRRMSGAGHGEAASCRFYDLTATEFSRDLSKLLATIKLFGYSAELSNFHSRGDRRGSKFFLSERRL